MFVCSGKIGSANRAFVANSDSEDYADKDGMLYVLNI